MPPRPPCSAVPGGNAWRRNKLILSCGSTLNYNSNFLSLERPGGGSNGHTIGFSDQKFEAFKQSK